VGLYSGYGRTLQWALTRASLAIAPTWADRMWLRPRRPRSPGRLDRVEAAAIRWVAAELARQREGLDPDPQVHAALTEAERRLRRERGRLAQHSAPKGPALRRLDRQLRAVQRGLRVLERRGLAPLRSDVG
jgi:hypothetical protein